MADEKDPVAVVNEKLCIDAYSQACGGHPTRGGGARMNAVVQVERALAAMFAADVLEREGGAG